MAQYRTAIIACGMIARVHTRGWLGVAGQPTQIASHSGHQLRRPRRVRRLFSASKRSTATPITAKCSTRKGPISSMCALGISSTPKWSLPRQPAGPKAILCQKPMAVDLREADEMLNGLPAQRRQADHRVPAAASRHLAQGARADPPRHYRQGDSSAIVNAVAISSTPTRTISA